MRVFLVVVMAFLVSSFTVVHKKWSCGTMPEQFSSESEAISVLSNTEFSYVDSFSTMSVRGIKQISYFSCDELEGYLTVEFHNRIMVYKNVPIEAWKEFKFSNSVEAYFEKAIKYNYLPA